MPPTYEDPGCFCKFFCSPCAVYQAQGCKCPEMAFALEFCCVYTMFCWDPTRGIANCIAANVTDPRELAVLEAHRAEKEKKAANMEMGR